MLTEVYDAILPDLPVVEEVGPKIGPRIAEIVANEDVGVAVDGAVSYVVDSGDVRGPAVILEVLFAEILFEPHGDDRGRRLCSIAA